MPRTRILFTFLAATMIMASGCVILKEKTYTPTEAEKKLSAFCLKEGNLAVTTRRVGLTLWIYAPIEEPIFDVKPSPDKDKPERKVQPFSLLSLQAEFSQEYFKLNYDVVPDVIAPEPTTYGSSYNEAYTKRRQLMYQALQESFFNAKAAPGDLMPQFVVVMISDVTKGIATKSTIYLRDLRQYLSEAIPPDEYYMREANEIIGKETLIGDKLGKNVPYADVLWTTFLTEQMKTRIKYKFTTDLPPHTVPADEVAKAAANTLRFYAFGDYTGVLLYDTRAKQALNLTKDLLKGYAEKAAWEDADRKLTTIHFQLPETPATGMVINSMTTTDASQPAP